MTFSGGVGSGLGIYTESPISMMTMIQKTKPRDCEALTAL